MHVRVDVWSDYVCPFCYLLEPTMRRLKREFGDRVEIRWRSYELRPDPVPTLDPEGDYLRDVWTRSVYPLAAERGMLLQLPPVQPRSRLAHEAAHFGLAHEKSEAIHTAIFRAFFEDGRDIGEPAVLLDLAGPSGLDVEALAQALETGRYRDAVLADEEQAAELKLAGVPATLIHRAEESVDNAIRISGAQPYSQIRGMVEQAMQGG